ncbi:MULTISPECIES: CPBP family intramembrane glutamic endopeptidase [Microbacterium]|uniref:CPBP family intramembrane metalloprotease n=1 Tax=Microbacterium wangchenii TaxID=2541726 RepID=A0ABX5SSC2_9MICO|nr:MULTISPECIES: CPBP family intramembrane glutamic endopeptidase [Microbacterium]MCK6066873.1 CPBP family intramembrane metalloprotease [Microbacterium sp. EYE_512]QBR88180.1 CPBP family intramembrane metalloprotease [Microbacterium wangchenii]TFV83698.1 CPBP family intramembrane metalloprotease [Microbacterium sp. dk485]TXK18030.1 CPBP family intramembrane metalloprotease [Microbacterium wangchenii]
MTAHAAPPAPTRPALSWGLVPALLVCLAAPAFFVLQIAWLGWILLAAGLVGAWLVERREGTASLRRRDENEPPSLLRDLSLIALGQLIVSAIPLKAELDNMAMLRFTVALGGAVLVPYLVSRYVYRDYAIRFPWRGGGRWTALQWGWLVAVLVLGWLILPFYFITSGVYTNWPVVDTPEMIARLFVGVGAVGIWDELFFICTVYVLLRRHFPDWQANLLQAVVFVSFLWELGYQAWGPVLTIPFALVQAILFLRTRSLGYVVTVHLLFDAVVFGVLVHAHNPGLIPIFLL